jgi:hypothetical protein
VSGKSLLALIRLPALEETSDPVFAGIRVRPVDVHRQSSRRAVSHHLGHELFQLPLLPSLICQREIDPYIAVLPLVTVGLE